MDNDRWWDGHDPYENIDADSYQLDSGTDSKLPPLREVVTVAVAGAVLALMVAMCAGWFWLVR